jgi:hypothetical protein
VILVIARSKPYLAPYSGCTIAEFFRDIGEPTLIIYDDLSSANSDLSLGFRSQEASLRVLECSRFESSSRRSSGISIKIGISRTMRNCLVEPFDSRKAS